MRLRVAGYTDVTTDTESVASAQAPSPLITENVYVCDTYVGQIIYYRRRRAAGGSVYGWMPATAPRNSRLTNKSDAVAALLRTDAAAVNAAAAREAAR